MTRLTNSLVSFAGLILLASIIALLMEGAGRGQQNSGGNSPARPRRYYLTTSDSPFGEGTAVALPRIWRLTDGPLINPWASVGELCFEPIRVWCVQD